MLRAALAVALLLPASAMAGAVAVCDGVLSQVGPDVSGNYSIVCSVAWRESPEAIPSWLSTLSIGDAGTLAGSVLLLWAAAWVFRMIRVALVDNAP